jgi:hypothetical protein
MLRQRDGRRGVSPRLFFFKQVNLYVNCFSPLTANIWLEAYMHLGRIFGLSSGPLEGLHYESAHPRRVSVASLIFHEGSSSQVVLQSSRIDSPIALADVSFWADPVLFGFVFCCVPMAFCCSISALASGSGWMMFAFQGLVSLWRPWGFFVFV